MTNANPSQPDLIEQNISKFSSFFENQVINGFISFCIQLGKNRDLRADNIFSISSLSVYVYLYYSLPFKIAHREPYHSPKSESIALRAAVQIRLFRPISPPSVSHSNIAFVHKLIYRSFNSRHTALIIRRNFLVRHVAKLMPPLTIPKIAVNHHGFLRNLITVDHFELSHRHHHPFLVR